MINAFYLSFYFAYCVPPLNATQCLIYFQKQAKTKKKFFSLKNW
jgi:hypothetical protein